ncbi:hypothetical protein Cpir12675_004558 [Ceratocystis pirilliformis]|uniref:Pinin/SDK/MemA protein domain-containing protein n=1 Tax=Ceratocystis pirilliformis TaxID=259994 RepID=A0ABR3YVJ0_9PEZI
MATEHQIVPDEQPVTSESTADTEMSVEQNTNNEDQPDPVLAPASTTLKRKAFQELETHCDETQKKARLGTRSPLSVRSCSLSPRAHSSPRSRHRNYSRSRSNSRSHSRTRPHSHSRSKSRSPSRRHCRNNDAHRRTRSPSPNRRIKREELKKEEQRRGKRLFGGLLNTLNKSQGNQYNSQATKRRQEIEERQKTKLRQQRVEGDKMRAQRGRKVKELRMREQIVFEEQVVRTTNSGPKI